MKTTPVLILAAVAAAAVIVAAIVSRSGRVETPADGSPAAARMFEGLAPRLNDVAAIGIKHGDKEFTLQKTGQAWAIPEKGGYPAKTEDVKKVLFQIGELRKSEERTSKPDLYSQLNVQDPDGKPIKEGENGPTLLTLKDDKGAVLASAIVGNTRQSSKPGVFIRKPGETQSWLAEGALEAPPEIIRWVDSSLINISRERIKGATSTQPDGSTVRVYRNTPEDPNFSVADRPAGKELKYPNAGDPLGSVLASLTFDDVAPLAQIDFEGKSGGKPGAYCEFRTFDGLMVAVQLTEKDGKTWGKFSAFDESVKSDAPKPDPAKPEPPKTEGDKPADAAKPADPKADDKSAAIKKEADDLNARLAPWAFEIPSWKLSSFNTKMSDLLKADEPPAQPPSLNGAPTPSPATPVLPPPAPK